MFQVPFSPARLEGAGRTVQGKMLQAEAVLAEYFRGLTYSPELEKQLADAVKAGSDEDVKQLAKLWAAR